MRPNYPFNCWYVAALSDEVGQGLLARRLLDKPVILYRKASGEVVAMEDRCVHRAFPLSEGCLDGDRVVCGYHGFKYDPDGTLVEVPSQENVPPGAGIRTYPIYETAPFVWIWLGEPGAAALRPPPRVPWYLDGSGWVSTTEVLRVEANFLLLHEHYLDLTDVFVTHPEVVPPDIQTLPPLNEVEISERSVAYTRMTPPSRLAPWESAITGLPEESVATRREEGTFVSPALHTQHYAIEVDGGDAYGLLRIHGFTPESPGATHVFLQMARNYANDEDTITEYLRIMFHEWAARDTKVLETIQRQLEEPGARRRDINVKADRAAIRARRIVMDMVDDETGRFALHRILTASD
ncbi:vanillate O-demethylase oxygenase [Mycobacterium sp. CBMA 234]|uniref:aromatic ring-hydroxylating dioxygenase subunit alpha n=1 Tax=Mycolicibacterium sp. CBMA 234 TaxID=1918495 RepID=UPI0012DFB303|nr:aromatic ring-hydroxylating dioxygenase subunit alpha [Mycolicibacterium sp. CBMA 234]MUL64655.1 vanillate O-demethylase oxygenase [Mycolicibacterium sp. CBMA 234]